MCANLNAGQGDVERSAWVAAYKAEMGAFVGNDEKALQDLADEGWSQWSHLDPVKVARAEHIRGRTPPEASMEEWRSVGYAAGLAGLPRRSNPHSRRQASPTSSHEESSARDERRQAWDGGWKAADSARRPTPEDS